MPCLIRDASRSGCRIVANKAHRLPDNIELHVESLNGPIEGMVVWCTARMAGVHFKHELSADILSDASELLDDETDAASPAAGDAELQEIAKRFSTTRIKS